MCAGRVDKTLRKVEGISNVVVNLEKACAEVTFDNECCNAEMLQQAVKDAGYEMTI